MKTDQPLFLNEGQVREHLRMNQLIPAMEKALIDFSAGRVTQPVRSVIKVDVASATGFLGLMPALTPDGLGLKAVTFYPSNAERGIPTHMATIFLVDPQTGTPLAIMDGRLITEMRTAAVSAAATKLLAPPDAKILAILGSGVQARSHVEALRLIRNFEEIRVWSPTRERAEQFAKEIGATAMSAEKAVRDADVIVTATNSKTPILRGAWLKAGCHVNAIGACRPAQMKRPSSNLSGWPSKISPQQCSFTDQLREGKTAAHLPKTRRQRKAVAICSKNLISRSCPTRGLLPWNSSQRNIER